MYSKEHQQDLQAATGDLLQHVGETTDDDAGKVIDRLVEVINYHDWRYYVEAEPVISDYDYDQLFKWLKELEEEYPELRKADSPTQRVARGLTETFETVEHNLPMLSLDNSYNEDDLRDFHDRLVRLVGDNLEYVAEPKFDGSSIALVYENDMLVRAATRGDGTYGEEITNNVKVLRSVPLSAEFSKFGIHKAEIRGEVVIRKEVFAEINAQRAEEGLTTFQNPRNTAAGGLRMKDPQEVSRRGMEALMYQVGYAVDKGGTNMLGKKLKTHYDNMQLLHQLGFNVPLEETGKFDAIEKVVKFCQEWEEKRNSYSIEIDGMVIKVNELHQQEEAGFTAHHPRWAMAYKFKAQQAHTKLERVEYQVGRTGAVTPVAKVTPVALAGVTISSISLHNEDFITSKDIRLGDTVIIERAGDVIPYIVGPVVNARTGDEQAIEFLRQCPYDGSELVKPEGESIWRCIDANCPAQAEERIIHFVSKSAMDIDGMGEEIVRSFMHQGLIEKLSDIYRLDYDKVLALEGWKEKSVENLRKGIEASKEQPLWRLMVGLSIRHVGTTTAKMLAKQVDHVLDFTNWSQEQFVELADIGPKVAESLYDFFHTEENISLIKDLGELGVNLKADERQEALSNVLDGQTFLFTGALQQFTRDEAKELVEQNGGKLLSNVSKNLNYLVVGENAGSKLTKAQKLETVKILSEDEFLDMIKKE